MRIKLFNAMFAVLVVTTLVTGEAVADRPDKRSAVKATLAKPVIRGGIVFKNYCKLCHGERADGSSRASKLYGSNKLAITGGNEAYYTEIIRSGGAAIGKSEFMPPWENELSEEQMNDVIAYLKIVPSSVRRGEVVYKTNCILCHGIYGNGKGRAARLYDPPPVNLTKSDKNDEYKRTIITLGGKAMGRSEFMPIWGEQLSPQEIRDVVNYLRTIVKR